MTDPTERVSSAGLESLAEPASDAERDAWMRLAFERSLDGILVADVETGRFVVANARMGELLGCPVEEILRLGIDDIHPAEALPRVRRQFAAQARGEMELALDVPVVRRDGSVFVADISAVRVERRERSFLLGIFRDASEREAGEAQVAALNQELETLVVRRTAELEAAVAELESFAHAVAHELRAPLRAVSGYTSLVLGDYGDVLGDRARHYLDQASGEAVRMARLIDDLLTLSRVSRASVRTYDVDLVSVVRGVLGDRTAASGSRQVHLEVPEQLLAAGDPDLLRQLVECLIDNALKFSSPARSLRLELGSVDAGEGRAYFLRDDGIGFDMRHAARVFEPFERLHALGEYPGSGMGLSLVARIARRHGGRVWIESEPDCGTTVLFTLGPNLSEPPLSKGRSSR